MCSKNINLLLICFQQYSDIPSKKNINEHMLPQQMTDALSWKTDYQQTSFLWQKCVFRQLAFVQQEQYDYTKNLLEKKVLYFAYPIKHDYAVTDPTYFSLSPRGLKRENWGLNLWGGTRDSCATFGSWRTNCTADSTDGITDVEGEPYFLSFRFLLTEKGTHRRGIY